MKKFSLLFETAISLYMKEEIERNSDPDRMIVGRIGIGYTDDFDKIYRIIDEVYKSSNIPFIAVVNNHSNTCFIYKAEGRLDEVIRVSLPKVLKMYEAMEGVEIILDEVKDVRDTMKFKPNSGEKLN